MATRTYEEELARTGALAFPVRGVSMRPLIKAGRDAVLVRAKDGRLERFDVGLFRRDNGEYVLHRVMSVQDGEYLFNGDSQTFNERIREDQVLGVMEGLVRNGKRVDLSGAPYRAYVALWCGLFPVRRLALKVLHKAGVWVPGKRRAKVAGTGLAGAAKAKPQAAGDVAAQPRVGDDAEKTRNADGAAQPHVGDGTAQPHVGDGAEQSQDVSQVVIDLLYLCGRALAGEPADPARVARMDLGRVHALATSQSLSALAWYALEPLARDGIIQGPLVSAWRADRDQAIRRQMLFASERSRVFEELDKAGIWHVSLKGAVLESYYPRVGMRTYSDNDVLCDPERRQDIARLFKERGYLKNADGHADGLGDSFTKEPVYRFEMNTKLFSGYFSSEVASFFGDVSSRLVGIDGSPYNLRLTSEDSYLYLVAHANKHFNSGGTGVRILCDLRVFLPREGESLDRGHVEQALGQMGIAEFAVSLERLAGCVFEADFDPGKLSPEDAEMLRALTSYGTYGTVDHHTELQMKRAESQGKTAGGYVLGRLLPDDDWWDVNFPFANEHRWAKGPLLVFRAARAAVEPERRHRIAAEVRALARKLRGK